MDSFHCKGVCPHKSCLYSIIKGIYHGIYYGIKISAPHAFVMVMLFNSNTL